MRRDVYLEQGDSDLFSVVCGCAVDEILADNRADDAQFYRRHHALLLEQAAPASLIVRIVTDEPLRDDETREWITRVRGHLDVADGRVLVMNGFNPDVLAAWELQGTSDWIAGAEVEIGLWDVDVYSYAGSSNGNAHLLRRGAPVGSWFRHDHPKARIPLWLAELLGRHGSLDPEYAAEWQDVATSIGLGTLDVDLEKRGFVGMLVHVHQRVEGEDDSPTGASFGVETGARTLTAAPAGVRAGIDDPRLVQFVHAITG